MNTNRRTFALLTAAAALCWGVRNALSSPIPTDSDSLSAASPLPEPPEKEERFPISTEDYRKVGTEYLPQMVTYVTTEPPGTIVVDTDNRFLYLVLGSNQAKRYGIGVGRDGFAWSGTATIKRKTEWPAWFPPKAMQARDREAARWRKGMPGGPRNPLGARALYLYKGEVDTLFRIHGTRDPGSVGRAVSSGCIRMLNADIIELFDSVPIGTKVVVLPSSRPVAEVSKKPARTKRAKMVQARLRRRRRIAAYRRRRKLRSIFSLFGVPESAW
jgi:lipoprotein-anchoring transpeptidase ErfK/SrfK